MTTEAGRPHPSSLDVRSRWVLLALLLMSVALNADRFILGADGPQRAHDLGDFNITNFMACGEYWTESGGYGWDASSLRGWPSAVGTYATQHLGCLAGAALPPPLIMPVLQVLLIALMTTGTFLFFRISLGFSAEGALGGTFLQLGSFYWFHEHDLVTSATLLLALIGFLRLRGAGWLGALRLLALLTMVGLLDPPATLVLMPLAHLACCLVVPLRDRRAHLTEWFFFWTGYGVYYAPTLLDYVGEFGRSNRSLFHAPPHLSAWVPSLRGYLYSVNVISPVLAAVILISRKSWRPALVGLSAMLLLVITVAANRYWIVEGVASPWPVFLAASTTYYRVFYMVPVVGAVMGAYLIERAVRNTVWAVIALRVAALAACVALATLLRRYDSGTYGYRPTYRALVGGSLIAYRALGRSHFTVACVLLLIAAWPLRVWYTRLYESPHEGNLFIEQACCSADVHPFRVATLMRTCDASDIFPAQAAVRGEETLEGTSNYYSRAFVEWWQKAVADRTGGCMIRYRYWNSRADLTVESWKKDSERLLAWMWFNNVALVRSVEPLDHPDLEFVDQRTFNLRWFGEVARYCYRLRDPLGRAFAVSNSVFESFVRVPAETQIARLRDAAASGLFHTVPLSSYQPSVISFRGAFGPDESVDVSVNFHPRWMLYVDGTRQDGGVQPGLFGTVRIVPQPGEHLYTLRFDGRSRPVILAGMLGGGLVFIFTLGGLGRQRDGGSA